MQFQSFEEIMEFAVAKEKEAVAFYTELSSQEMFSGSRDTFRAFAEEERKHQRMLENFGRDSVAEYRLKPVPDLKRSDYLVDLAYEPGMTYADILRLATKREEKAHGFYSDFAGLSHNPEHRKLFQILAQEEAKHKLHLETLLDEYLARMGD